MFNHVHGHSHISGFLRNYMCKTIFLAGKHNACELCWTGKIATWPGQVVKPCSPSSLTFQNNNPKTRQNWLHKNSTIISTNTLIFHLCYWLRRIFWMFGCCRRVHSSVRRKMVHTFPKVESQFPCTRAWNCKCTFSYAQDESEWVAIWESDCFKVFADWFTIRRVLIQIHAHVLMDMFIGTWESWQCCFAKPLPASHACWIPLWGRLWWFLSLLSHFGGLFVGNVPISMTYSKRF